MSYEKRLCVLKQIKRGFSADGGALSGAVYAERYRSDLMITPKISDIAPILEGRYAFAVWVGEKTYYLEAKFVGGLKIVDAPSLKDGFSILLCFLKPTAKPEPVAYGYCGNAPTSYERLLNVFQERESSVAQKAASFVEPPQTQPEQEQTAPLGMEDLQYHDEAIAEENYFDEEICSAEQPLQSKKRELTYYRQVESRFSEAMKKYPKDGKLNQIFPHSEWVKTENAYLGIIYEEGLPLYLCVAVEGEQPPSMQNQGVFVPKNFYGEDGYYIVFQDADTGEYVRPEQEEK